MKRSPWFPVWTGFQDDEQFLAVSAEAELLYFRAVARCKQLDQGRDGGTIGRHQLRRLTDKMAAVPEDLAAELVAVGLWDEAPMGWVIVAYGEWNTSAEEEREARAEHGKRGNHARWKHPGRFEDCPTCHPVDNHVSPGESGAIQGRIPDASSGNPQPSLDVDETRRDETTPPGSDQARDTVSCDPAGPRVVAVADGLMERLGYATPPTAGPDIRRYVDRAIGRGWSVEQLCDLAAEAGSREGVSDAAGWLRGALKRCANEDPPTPVAATAAVGPRAAAGGDWSHQWALMTGGHSSQANEAARQAWFDTRQVRRYDTETSAKFAFRDAYLTRAAVVPA